MRLLLLVAVCWCCVFFMALLLFCCCYPCVCRYCYLGACGSLNVVHVAVRLSVYVVDCVVGWLFVCLFVCVVACLLDRLSGCLLFVCFIYFDVCFSFRGLSYGCRFGFVICLRGSVCFALVFVCLFVLGFCGVAWFGVV